MRFCAKNHPCRELVVAVSRRGFRRQFPEREQQRQRQQQQREQLEWRVVRLLSRLASLGRCSNLYVANRESKRREGVQNRPMWGIYAPMGVGGRCLHGIA
nr:MAG TPA: hypothetical protein [Caudoviricetes sp.]